jgi:hypothetical protein
MYRSYSGAIYLLLSNATTTDAVSKRIEARIAFGITVPAQSAYLPTPPQELQLIVYTTLRHGFVARQLTMAARGDSCDANLPQAEHSYTRTVAVP